MADTMIDADYHNHPAWSSTRIKAAVTGTMLRYWSRHVDPTREPFVPTDVMRQGSLLDCVLTEPEGFATRYMVAPKMDRRTTAGKQLAAEFERRTMESGAEVVPSDWMMNALGAASRLRADPTIGPLISNLAGSQEAHFWTDEELGIECRYKPDFEPFGCLLDLKKTRCANPRLFTSDLYRMAYDVQIAHYRDGYISRHGVAPARCGFIAVEWEPPHDYSLIWLSDELIAEGERRRREAIERIMECEAADEWPSYGETTVHPPRWADAENPAEGPDLTDLNLEGL